MKKMICLIGVGEIGGVLARGILRTGHPIYPVKREMQLKSVAQEIPDPQTVIVAVGEKDLPGVLGNMPAVWKDKVVLLQNELLPMDWEKSSLVNPTVISIWFEKKTGQDYQVILPSPVLGPAADFLKDALESMNIPCRVLHTKEELLFELVLKNIYILTTNIAGMEVGGTVGALWLNHQVLARQVAGEIMDIQFWLIEKNSFSDNSPRFSVALDREKLIQSMVRAFEADPEHKCMGRSAPSRLERAIFFADQAGLAVPKLRMIA